MAKSFIHYEMKNGKEYASIYTPQRVNGIKDNAPQYLGRVIDKEKGIFQSRSRGRFCYTLSEGFYDFISNEAAIAEEKYILDFGSLYALREVLNGVVFSGAVKQIMPDETDTFLSVLFYRILESGADYYAEDWWEGSYARILYPRARLKSQRISEFLCKLGEEGVVRSFFKKYIPSLVSSDGCTGILIDSSALPNDIHFPLTAAHTEAGETNRETRLILVVDRINGMPLFFRYNAGNIVDVSTLKATIKELSLNGIKTEHAIVDAGYYSEKNIKALYEEKVSFLTRLIPNRKLYKELAERYGDDINRARYLVSYSGRILYVKRVKVDLFGSKGFAYIAVDNTRRAEEINRYAVTALEDKVSPEEMDEMLRTKGMFILLSSEAIEPKELLPLYYSRQKIEQIFDISKNYAELLPIRKHNEKTFRGHLLLTFIASAVFTILQNKFKDTKYNPVGAFTILRNLKCKVYDKTILIKEPTRRMKEIMNILEVNIPDCINIV
jgi:hypothetical protein